MDIKTQYILHLFKIYLLTVLKWIPRYIYSSMKKGIRPIHIIFALLDHYEPGTGRVPKEIEQQRVNELVKRFPQFAKNHIDSTGNRFRITWFFPPITTGTATWEKW